MTLVDLGPAQKKTELIDLGPATSLLEPTAEDLEKYRTMGATEYRSPSGRLYNLTPKTETSQYEPVELTEATIRRIPEIVRRRRAAGREIESIFPKLTKKPLTKKIFEAPQAAIEYAKDIPQILEFGKMYVRGSKDPYTGKPMGPKEGEIYDRFKNMLTRALSPLAYLMPGVTRRGLIEELDKEAEEFSGFGPATVKAGGKIAGLSAELIGFQKAFGATHALVERAKELPKVARLLKAVKQMGGVRQFAAKFPRIANASGRILQAFGEGEIIGQTYGFLEAMDEGYDFPETLKVMNVRGATFGGIAGAFQLASSIDNALYIRKLRSYLVKNTYNRYNAKIEKLPGGLANPKARGFVHQAEMELQQIDNIVSATEAQLIGLKSGKLARGAFEKAVESPQKAAERIIKYGWKPGKGYIAGQPELKKGLGKPIRKPLLPTTKVGEVVETIKEIPKAVKQAIRPAAKPVRAVKPPVKAPVEPTQIKPTIRPSRAELIKAVDKGVGKNRLADLGAEKPAEKQPWEMTAKEFRANTKLAMRDAETGKVYEATKDEGIHTDMLPRLLAEGVKTENMEGGFILPNGEFLLRWSKAGEKTPSKFRHNEPHEYLIQQALSEGKPVPRHILEEYKGQIWADKALKKLEKPNRLEPLKKLSRPLKELGGMPEKPPGLTKAETEYLGRREQEALRAAQQRGLPVGFKMGAREEIDRANSKLFQIKMGLRQKRADVKAIQSEMYDYIKRRLPITEQAKVMSLLKQVRPEQTQKTNLKNLVRAIARTEKIVKDIAKRQAISELQKTAGDIKSRIGKPFTEGGIRAEYAEKLSPILDSFIKPEATERTQRSIASLSRYLHALRQQTENKFEEAYAESLIPNKRLAILDRIKRKPLRRMTIDELRTINEELQRLAHLNRTKNRIIMSHRIADVRDITKRAKEEVENVINRSKYEEALSAVGQKESLIAKVGQQLGGKYNDDVETLVERITGGRQGAIYESIVQNIREGRELEARHIFECLDYFRDALKKNNITDEYLRNNSRLFFKAFGRFRKPKMHRVTIAGRPVDLTMGEVMSIYMHSRAHDNLTKMLKNGLAFYDRIIGRITSDELQAITNLIGPKEKALCDAAAHIFEKITKPALNKVTYEMDGIRKFREPDYWHMETYGEGKMAGKKDFAFSLIETRGWTKERGPSRRPLVIRDFYEQLLASVNASGEFVGLAKPLRSVRQILNNPEITRAIDAKGYRTERKLLKDILERLEQHPRDDSYISHFFGVLMRGATRARLAEPGIFAGQYSSVAGYFTEADFKRLKELRVRASAEDIKEIKDHWAVARRRFEGNLSSIALGDVAQTDRILRSITGKTKAINWTTEGIRFVDSRAIVEAWRIAKAEVKDSGLKEGMEGYWDTVRKRADYLVRRTQPMFDTESRSVLTSDPRRAIRQFVLFRSYIDQSLRMFHRANVNLANGNISKAQWSRQVGIIWGSLAANVIIRQLIRLALYALPAMAVAEILWGKHKAPSIKDEAYKMGRDTVLSPVKILTYVGYLAYSTARRGIDIAAGKKVYPKEADFDTLPITVVESIWKTLGHFSDAAGYLGTGEKYKSGEHKGEYKAKVELEKGITELTLSLGLLLGMPVTPAERIRSELKKQRKEKKKSWAD